MSEQSTQYELLGMVANGIERNPFTWCPDALPIYVRTHLVGPRFISPVPNKTISAVSADWMLMLAPSVVASIVERLPPAFEWIASKKEPVSYRANKEPLSAQKESTSSMILRCFRGSTSEL